MKSLFKLWVIPIVIGLIAGLTYISLDSSLNSDKLKQLETSPPTEKNYKNEDSDKDNSKIKEKMRTANNNIVDIIKKEEKKINRSLDKINNKKLLEGFEFIFNDLNQEIEEKKDTSLLIESLFDFSEGKLNFNQQTKAPLDSKKIIIEVKEDNLPKSKEKDIDVKQKKEVIDDLEMGSIEVETKKDVNQEDKKKEIKNKIFLGVKDGYVAVYRGESLEENELEEIKKDIAVKNLSDKDKKDLIKGIEVDSQEELLSILEGFRSADEG
ncbi:BofC C-terminal domain-containing protein [Orenia marismortui]|uniref:BofC C-terminal domain-containing protein n=1 Tax=Orenia marismortui TaxID=46469 RepID=UPI00037C3803|nr:BofC C-terminal domain-containing protein [Orenia marismortui]